MDAGDRAGQHFWNSLWAAKTSTRAVGSRPLTRVEQQFATVFDRAFALLGDPRGKHLLEVGCGDSGWLPFFARRWGLEVHGVDYSPVGCERAKEVASSQGVAADIVCANLFTPPREMKHRFDAVVSMGVIEHFDDTAEVLRALGEFVAPGGLLVTTIPNLSGMPGRLFRSMNPQIYETHVPLDVKALRSAHEAAGFTVVEDGYLMSINLGVINLVGLDPEAAGTRIKRVALLAMMALSRAVWVIERIARPFPARRALSPYAFVIARR